MKKLEKNLEKYKTDCDRLSEQNEEAKQNQKNLNAQLETKSKESTSLKEINSDLEAKNQNFELEVNVFLFKN